MGVGVVMEEGADFFADGGRAGLAEQEDGMAGAAKGVGKECGLGGFARAFDAFKRDEQALERHWNGLERRKNWNRVVS